MVITNSIFNGKKVLVTGHTGFKGAWLSMMLKLLGADVHGISLPVPNSKLLYKDALLNEIFMSEYFLDIRDVYQLEKAIEKISPDYTFHLAAQSLVFEAYNNPVETFDINIMGTLNVLKAVLKVRNLQGVCISTTDKVYRNENKQVKFTENDSLGNHDPYSASKAATELVVESFASIQLSNFIPISTVRAGNVIGGGDWATNRLIPDIVRSIQNAKSLEVRHPSATRPWQYVLDCIWGYILVAERQIKGKQIEKISNFNFGPEVSISVNQVIEIFEKSWGTKIERVGAKILVEEKKDLLLDSNKARDILGWRICLEPEIAVMETAYEYLEMRKEGDVRSLLIGQIDKYFESLD